MNWCFRIFVSKQADDLKKANYGLIMAKRKKTVLTRDEKGRFRRASGARQSSLHRVNHRRKSKRRRRRRRKRRKRRRKLTAMVLKDGKGRLKHQQKRGKKSVHHHCFLEKGLVAEAKRKMKWNRHLSHIVSSPLLLFRPLEKSDDANQRGILNFERRKKNFVFEGFL